MSAGKCQVCGENRRIGNRLACSHSVYVDVCYKAERLAIERANEIERLKDVQANMEMEIENLKFKLAESEAQECALRESCGVAFSMGKQFQAEQVENLKAEIERMQSVVEAAKCIRHWHDSGKDGMIVSRDKVFKLWDELKNLDEIERMKAARIEIPPPPEGFEAVLHLPQMSGQCSQADFELTSQGWKKPSFGISSAQIIARKKEMMK